MKVQRREEWEKWGKKEKMGGGKGDGSFSLEIEQKKQVPKINEFLNFSLLRFYFVVRLSFSMYRKGVSNDD